MSEKRNTVSVPSHDGDGFGDTISGTVLLMDVEKRVKEGTYTHHWPTFEESQELCEDAKHRLFHIPKIEYVK